MEEGLMDDTAPEELQGNSREVEKEIAAESEAGMAEATAELAADAQARAHVVAEEAEMWGGVDTSDEKIHEVMTRAMAEIVVREEFEKQLRSGRKLRVKLGIDPTGPLLHIGRSVPLLKLRQLQDMGHQIVLIIGDFTSLVGDASDKDERRPMLTREQIEKNMETYKEQIGHLLDLDKVEFRYNSHWLAPLNFNDVINLASRFTVAQMIQRENFSDRWDAGKPIGLHEIMYPLMQGFDSVAVEADVELGGTDQLFNLMAGRIIQESFGQIPQTVICINMIAGTDGRKMSTSWGNGIYILDDAKNQFGKIMSMSDDMIPVYLESCTRVPMPEVERVRKGLDEGSLHPMDAKKDLAWEIVRMYHGIEAANQARADFERQFQNRELPTEIPLVPLDKAKGDKADENGEVGILDLLINTGLAPNRKRGQRLVEQGGVRVGEERITDREQRVKPVEGMVVKVGRSYVQIGD
jgi:tyrosyl-tRNA synthetase